MAATQECGHQPPLNLIEEVIIEASGIRVSFAFALTSKHNHSARPEKETWELHQLRAELDAVRYQNQCYALEKAEWLEDRRNLCRKLQKLKQDLQRMEELQKEKELTEEHQRTSQGVCLYQEQFSSLEVQLSSGQGDDVHQPSPQQISQRDTDLLRPGSGEDVRSRWLAATKKNLETNGITFLNNDTICEARNRDLQRKLAGKENVSVTEQKEVLRKKKAEQKLIKREQKEKKRPNDQEGASSPRAQKSNILLKAVRDILTYMGRSCRRKQCSPRLKEELKALRKELKTWMKDRILSSSPPPSHPPPLLLIIVQCPTASK